MDQFTFNIGASVRISVSGEEGIVKGRADYGGTRPQSYLVDYKAADGRAVSAWWDLDQLETA